MEKLGAGDPRRIGAYRLLARLGAGGMGQVYLARSDRGRTTAVKLVRRELAAREEFRERFRQEVRAAQRVGGHWTAPVLDADTEAEVPWVATGYVAGPSLDRVVARDHGALPERTVRVLAAGLAHALQDIHAAGIVHRDLKPSNVLVTIDGPRVIDFGIARALETVTDGGLTRTGVFVGSPGFMTPEQVRGDRVTPASDVFCLGSVLAFAATGSLPFGGPDSGMPALMYRIAQGDPDLSGVPEGIADLVRDCLRKDPAARPALDQLLRRTGAEETVSDGRSRDPWLPGALVAQLGRHAVRLLDAEDPEPSGHSGGGGAGPGGGEPSGAVRPDPSAEHAQVADGSGAVAFGPPPSGHQPADRRGPLAPHPAYEPPAAYGCPPQGHSGHGYGPADHATDGRGGDFGRGGAHGGEEYGHGHGGGDSAGGAGDAGSARGAGGAGYGGPGETLYAPPPEPPRRNGRATAALVVIAAVVALAAGGSVYALMSGHAADDVHGRATASASTPAGPGPAARQSTPGNSGTGPASSAPADGAVPSDYVGTWTAAIDTGSGRNTRVLTIRQGRVGDTVLSLAADGPTPAGSYHCVFEAALSDAPSDGGPLAIGPSTVAAGEPASACTPGGATEVALQADGTLRRVNTATGEELTYRRG